MLLSDSSNQFGFVGAWGDEYGYAHAGVVGRSCDAMLTALATDVPTASVYFVMIGINDGPTSSSYVTVGDKILAIIDTLLARGGCDAVFTPGILPCPAYPTDVDPGTTLVNSYLLAATASRPRMHYLEISTGIRAYAGYPGSLYMADNLHFLDPAGYSYLGHAFYSAMAATGVSYTLSPPGSAAVKVANLFNQAGSATLGTGNYVFSCRVLTSASSPAVYLDEALGGSLLCTVPYPCSTNGPRIFRAFDNMSYVYSTWTVRAVNCTVDQIMMERRRPSGLPSVYVPAGGVGFDVGNWSHGEYVERGA